MVTLFFLLSIVFGTIVCWFRVLEDESEWQPDSRLVWGFVGVALFGRAFIFFFQIWVVFTFFKIYHQFGQLPYMEDWSRQMVLRLFVRQTLLVMLTWILLDIFVLVRDGLGAFANLESQRLSKVILVSGYSWLFRLAFTEFIKNKQKPKMKGFHPSTALLASSLTDIIYQYKHQESGSLIELEKQESKDVEALGFLRLKTVRNWEKDLKVYICKKFQGNTEQTRDRLSDEWRKKFVSGGPKDQFVVVFRGTVSKVNHCKVNIWFQRRKVVSEEWFNEKCTPGKWESIGSSDNLVEEGAGKLPSVRIHAGYWEAWNDIREKVLRCILSHIYLNQNEVAAKYSQILVCGHSLGGALAQLCALNLSLMTGLSICVYTLGAPRIGGRTFAKLMNERVPYNYRIIMVKDPITAVPKGLPPYVHAGVPCWIDATGHMIISPSWTERQMVSTNILPQNMVHHKSDLYVEAMKRLNKGMNDTQSFRISPYRY